MKPFYLLENAVRDYAWGDSDSIPNLLGYPVDSKKPQAELWMGAHPGAPSRLTEEPTSIDLGELISRNPQEALGLEVAERFGRLPFLFKLLAAGQALSIQAHPDKRSAEAGFAREDARGIPRDAPTRNYKDDNHKPEIIMALSPFSAMIGFRPLEEILRHFALVGFQGLNPTLMRDMERRGDDALREFFSTLMNLGLDQKHALLSLALNRADTLPQAVGTWLRKLSAQYPNDIGALAPLYLNLVELEPGQALYQPARSLHAYLQGFGIELMANSDNVLRGGCTHKHVDVPELLSVLDFCSTEPEVLALPDNGTGIYPTPAEEFALAIGDGSLHDLPLVSGPRIIICLEEALSLMAQGERLEIQRGQSAFLPATGISIRVEGSGCYALAGVPS